MESVVKTNSLPHSEYVGSAAPKFSFSPQGLMTTRRWSHGLGKTKEGSAILKHISGLQDLGLLELSTFGTLVCLSRRKGAASAKSILRHGQA